MGPKQKPQRRKLYDRLQPLGGYRFRQQGEFWRFGVMGRVASSCTKSGAGGQLIAHMPINLYSYRPMYKDQKI